MPEPNTDLPARQLRLIDQPCDAFDLCWAKGERPAIENHLNSTSPDLRFPILNELVRMELEWRCRRGEEPSVEEYATRFPECAAELASWLAEARAAGRSWRNVQNTPSSAVDTPSAAEARRLVSTSLPRVLGEYELLERLGGGGMGEVFSARHRRLDRLVAVKLLYANRQHSVVAIARFLREMKAMGQIDHPHVVEAQDAGECDGLVYLVMKLLQGKDLHRLVKEQGPLPVDAACEMIRQAALGLQHLHEHGLVHRDVKPSNLMQTTDGTVKVLDLGLARLHDLGEPANTSELTETGAVVGTPDYLAPEQAGGEVDARADLYALGASLFYLLTGRAPFAHHANALKKMHAHDLETPPDVRDLRPDVPAGVAHLIARLLAKRPQDRPATAAEVARLLDLTADGSENIVAPPTPPKRFAWRWWLMGGAAAALAVVLLIALWPDFSPPSRSPAAGETKADPESAGAAVPKGNAPAEPVHIVQLKVLHWSTNNGKETRVGEMGRESFQARLNDSVDLEAELSRPGYAYLIAFRPDGTEEVCFPEKDSEAPPLTARPRYPWMKRDKNYGLDEGTGLYVFAAVASSKPLPPYRQWWARLPKSPWTRHEAQKGEVVVDAGGLLEFLTSRGVQRSERGKGRKKLGGQGVIGLTDWLRSGADIEAVTAVGFAVVPRE